MNSMGSGQAMQAPQASNPGKVTNTNANANTNPYPNRNPRSQIRCPGSPGSPCNRSHLSNAPPTMPIGGGAAVCGGEVVRRDGGGIVKMCGR
ncbi:hypothetical protein ACLKA7_008666 [Drosophila subpalustris]